MTSSRRLRTPAHPLLLAHRLERRRRWQGFVALCRHARWRSLAAALAAGVVALAGGCLLPAHAAAVLVPLHAHPFSLFAVTALLSGAVVLSRRRRGTQQFAASWLASAPLTRSEVLGALRRRVASELGALAGIAATLIAVAGWAGQVPSGRVLFCIALGTAAGTLLGWRMGGQPPRSAAPALPRLGTASAHHAGTSGTSGLSRWPLAQLRAAANPPLHAALVGGFLVSLPHGVPLQMAVPLLLLLCLALAAQALLAAMLAVIPPAADWLRSSPISDAKFQRALLGRAAIWQVIAAALASALMLSLGTPTLTALALGAAWLAWCASALGAALRWRYRTPLARVERGALGVVLLAIGLTSALALALLWPLLWLWQWRRSTAA